ncbi:acyltransferase [Oceanicola sp. 22II-s10i]|uniref:lysophospholipid acyltransferase family protein n=1 Tax=Oceanicola sp. 22II-s10i TaxID=1317116 RepID=UPI000B51FC46|nr:lysophospholipid acyltransferase family protein [Oceanicola sp. 22II-s10i]OWU83861.1 acyltransferase [Oceanicola sp. 22II-s10i]
MSATTQHSTPRHIARELSYSHSGATKLSRAFIRTLENVTGRPGLIRRAAGYENEVAAGRDFWSVMMERYGLELEITAGSLDNIPRTGPLVMIANHPYGILDGLMMGHILQEARGDFRILANHVFRKSEDLNRIILPINFDETKEALATNIETRKTALSYLAQGGAIGVFPGGTVSTALKPFSQPMDPGWRSFTARMIAKSGAQVVPIYFEGRNSRLFQLASHVHYTLRLGLLLKEFRSRVGTPVRCAIGTPIPADQIAARVRDSKALMDYLRRETYSLSTEPLKSLDYGFEFEEKHRTPPM